jgi:alkylation response protein AidB-like acyl-CoA dehydrogenase
MSDVLAAMRLLYSEEQRLAIDGFRRFAEAELRPLAAKYEKLGCPPDRAALLKLFRRLDDFGLVSGLIAADDGGPGIDRLTYGLLYEELARVWPDMAIAILIQSHVALTLCALGSAEIKKTHLQPLLRAERIGCSCISEPAVGSNVAEVQTRAVRDGDQYKVRGQKLWISNGAQSDFAIVVCRIDGSLTMLIVDRDGDNYSSRELEKMGLVSASTCELFFDDAVAPVGNLLGGSGGGLLQTLKLFETARVFVGLTAVGIAQAALEEAIAYAKQRRQHGKVIAAHQLIQAYIAEMATEVDAARLLCQRALRLLDQGIRCDTQTSMAKWYATEMAVGVASKAIQIHGGVGITKEFAVERHFRNARILPIPDGTTEIQKLIMGRNIVGHSAFS